MIAGRQARCGCRHTHRKERPDASLAARRNDLCVTRIESLVAARDITIAGQHDDRPYVRSGTICLLARLQTKAKQLARTEVRIAVIQEASLDGFWVHRLLQASDIESHVVDPASIAVPRRQRRAKTDAIDGETLLRTLLAWKRSEPRVCSAPDRDPDAKRTAMMPLRRHG